MKSKSKSILIRNAIKRPPGRVYTIKDLDFPEIIKEMPDTIFEVLMGDRARLQKTKNKRRKKFSGNEN